MFSLLWFGGLGERHPTKRARAISRPSRRGGLGPLVAAYKALRGCLGAPPFEGFQTNKGAARTQPLIINLSNKLWAHGSLPPGPVVVGLTPRGLRITPAQARASPGLFPPFWKFSAPSGKTVPRSAASPPTGSCRGRASS